MKIAVKRSLVKRMQGYMLSVFVIAAIARPATSSLPRTPEKVRISAATSTSARISWTFPADPADADFFELRYKPNLTHLGCQRRTAVARFLAISEFSIIFTFRGENMNGGGV